jgi:hypothetical protein
MHMGAIGGTLRTHGGDQNHTKIQFGKLKGSVQFGDRGVD